MYDSVGLRASREGGVVGFGGLRGGLLSVVRRRRMGVKCVDKIAHFCCPLRSLGHLLNARLARRRVRRTVRRFSSRTYSHLKGMATSSGGKHFYVALPPRTSSCIRRGQGPDRFLMHFVNAITHRNYALSRIVSIFRTCSSRMRVRGAAKAKFSCLMCFRSKVPSSCQCYLSLRNRRVVCRGFAPRSCRSFKF